MRQVFINNFEKLLIALLAIVAPIPAGATIGEVTSPAETDKRIAAISYRLAMSAEPYCVEREQLTGTSFHEPAAYASHDREALLKKTQLGWGFTVLAVVAGGPGDRAGLQPGDEIIALNDIALDSFARRLVKRKATYDRIEAFNEILSSQLATGPAKLVVRRGLSRLTTVLHGDSGCGGQATVEDSKSFNAWSDGRYVAVSSNLISLTPDDEELAFVLAHEMAHNILGHNARFEKRSSLFGPKGGVQASAKSKELQADALSIQIMAAAGFDVDASVRFLDHSRRYHSMNFSLTHPSYENRLRGVTLAIATSRVQDRLPLPSAAPRIAHADTRNVTNAALLKLPEAFPSSVFATIMRMSCHSEFLIQRCTDAGAGEPAPARGMMNGASPLQSRRLKGAGATLASSVDAVDRPLLPRGSHPQSIFFQTRIDTPSRLLKLADNASMRLGFNGLGHSTFEISHNIARPFGTIASYGDANAPAISIKFRISDVQASLDTPVLKVIDEYLYHPASENGTAQLQDMIAWPNIWRTSDHIYSMKQAEQMHQEIKWHATDGPNILLR